MKIFVGYPSERGDAAEKVVSLLTEWGHDVWYDKRNLLAGEHWDDVRREAQATSDLLIHLCSSEIYNRGGVFLREIRQSLRQAEDQPFNRIYVMFIRLEELRLPPQLLHIHYIDYFSASFAEKFKRAIEGATSERTLPEPSAIPPTPILETGAMQKISFEESTDFYDCDGSYVSFPTTGTYWTLINAKCASVVLDEFYSFRSDFIFEYNDIGDRPKSFWSMHATQFYQKGEFVSIIISSNYYWSGAAHPNIYIRTLNFVGEKIGFVEIGHLLGHNDDNAKRILKYCEAVIHAGLDDDSAMEESIFQNYLHDIENVWSLISQFNFDEKGITFNFSPYSLLPYAFGVQDAFVPWSFVEPMLGERYQELPQLLKS